MHDFQIGIFIPAAPILNLAQTNYFQDAADGTAMVFDAEPFADILTVTRF